MMKRRGNNIYLFKILGIYQLDKYLIGSFLWTFIFSLSLIMAIIVAVDIQEKLEVFMKPNVSIELILRYYISMIPYFANLLSPLFIFITVVFFTSKLAARSEIIAMQAAGMSFNRILKPYMISAGIISIISFFISTQILPKLNRIRVDFEETYVTPDRKVVMDRNIQVVVAPGQVAFFSSFESSNNTGYNFSLEKYEDNTLTSRLTARRITYDSLFHWTLHDYNIRDFQGLIEKNSSGEKLDTMLILTPKDLIIGKHGGDQLTNKDLKEYINKQQERGVGNIQSFEVEYHRRFASIPAAFILTLIGVSLSARKVKGGIALNIAIGLGLAFTYILLFTVSSSYAVNGALSPLIAAWLPNIIFLPIAGFLYFKAPR